MNPLGKLVRSSFLFVMAACLFVAGASLAFGAPPTTITLDGSLGHAAGTVLPTSPGLYQITPGMGKSVGSNLFQSFGTFNLGTGNIANFEANVGTQNIVARVTGGSASSIDGTITSTVGSTSTFSNANLFLINPAGIMFTANASLSLNGAFVASTANYVKMNDGTVFYADTQHPINDAGLSSAPVSAFGFMPGGTPEPVTVTGSQLDVPGGLHVISGDITLDQGATLFSGSGNLSLFSAANGGEVPFNLSAPGAGFASATNTSFGNVTLQNQSAVLTGGAATGHVIIRGGRLVVKDNSLIGSINSGASAPADVLVQATSLTFQGGGRITTQASSSGASANIFVQSGTISADGASAAGNSSGIFTSASSTGDTGSINVNASGDISLTNGGRFFTSTTNSSGGDIVVTCAGLVIDGVSPVGLNSSIIALGGGAATSGSVQVTAGPIIMTNGGEIDTLTSFNGGDIFITASSLMADGVSVAGGAESGINAFASGAGTLGTVHIDVAGELDLTNGAVISIVPGSGGAGTISVSAGRLVIAGLGLLGNDSGIFSSTFTQNPAGTINVVVAGEAILAEGGSINSASFSSGNAGDVVFQAGSLAIDGFDAFGDDSGFFSGTNATTGGGNGGSVSVTVTGALSLTNGGTINASTQGTGNAGDVLVNCGSLAIDGFDFNGFASGITSLAVSSGNGGNITVNVAHAASLTNGGDITADGGGQGAGGDIQFTAGQLSIDGATSDDLDSEITSASVGLGGGGMINIAVNGAMSLTNGGQVDANAIGGGNAGDISVRAGQLHIGGADSILQDSSISSRTKDQGNSGIINVNVTGGLSITGGGQITAASYGSGNAGDVTVRTGSLSVGGLDVGGSASAITSSGQGSGNGGQVDITALGNVDLINSGLIVAFSIQGDAGDITMHANNLTMMNKAGIGTEAANNGGSINLTIHDIAYLFRSAISASAGDIGGNITIDPEFVVLDQSQITAFGGVANGNITIDTLNFLDQDSPITATGVITISVPDLNLSGSLIALPNTLDSDENKLKETCARSVKHEFSSLIVVGRGGTELSPDELQPDFGIESPGRQIR